MPSKELPQIGLGTLRNTDPEQCANSVSDAIEIGYRHIDTAQKYGNEQYVGNGIAGATVPREELFIATKIDETNLGYEAVHETFTESRENLGVETVDLLYLHWPAVSSHEDRYDATETLPAFTELIEDGAVNHVGVGNFSIDLIEEAQEHLDVPIFANQVEMHPLLQQDELVSYAQANDMYLIAYSPLLRGDLGRVPELREIAQKHDATSAQVSLAWCMSKRNVIPIPKGRGDHLRENYEARTLDLDAEDVELIDSIEREHRIVDRTKGPWTW